MQVDTMEPSRSSLTADSLILTELAASPLTAAELKRRVKKRLGKISATALNGAIDQLVAAQRIHGRRKFSKAGKPTKTVESYALGAPPPPPPPPEELARAEVLKQLEQTSPSATELKKRVRGSVPGLSAKAFDAVVVRLAAEKRIHSRYKRGKNGKPTKTVESYALGAPPPPPPPPEELARAEILKQLQRASQSATELKERVCTSVAGLPTKAFDLVVAGLAAEKKLYVRYKRGKNGKPTKTVERYTLEALSPTEFLGPVLHAWELAKAEANAAGLEEQALVAALLSEFGVAAQGSSASERELVLSALRDLVAREGDGSLIAMRKLRAVVPLPKSRFDALLLALSAEDAVILHHHDYVASLSAEEREALVVDDYGNSYIGVAIRGGS